MNIKDYKNFFDGVAEVPAVRNAYLNKVQSLLDDNELNDEEKIVSINRLSESYKTRLGAQQREG